MTKQTAANNPFLKAVKKQFNAPTFRQVSEVLNTNGSTSALDLILSLYNDQVRTQKRIFWGELLGCIPNKSAVDAAWMSYDIAIKTNAPTYKVRELHLTWKALHAERYGV